MFLGYVSRLMTNLILDNKKDIGMSKRSQYFLKTLTVSSTYTEQS
jgi:hypothetical protein